MELNEEHKIRNKIEIFGVAVIMTLLIFYVFGQGKKAWIELSVERKKQLKKALINDFKLACILTIIVVIFLIFTDSFNSM